MLQIDYKITNRFKKPTDAVLLEADDGDFLYHLFTGDITLKNDYADFSTHWDWVTVIDFIVGLNLIFKNLQKDTKQRFEFTESEASLSFVLKDDSTHVTASYADGVLVADYVQACETAKAALEKLKVELVAQHPVLSRNNSFLDLMKVD